MTALPALGRVRDELPTIHALRDDVRTACGLRASPQVPLFANGPACGRCRRILIARANRNGIDAHRRKRRGAS